MRRFLRNTCLVALSCSVLAPVPGRAEGPFLGRAEANWRYGQERAILMTEFWLPVAQDGESVLYADLRLMGDDHDNREGNAGLGYRRMTALPVLGDGVAGVHGWLDRRITARGSRFHQATLGAEWLGGTVDILANAYIPLSDGKSYSVPNANPQDPAFTGTGIVVDTPGTLLEEPQRGLDLELGWQVPFLSSHTDSIRVYGGGYAFDGAHTDSVTGWRTRLAVDISPNVQIGSRFQKDGARGSQGFIEATLRFPFGSKKSYRREGLRARLGDAPERDIDIVTGSRVTDDGDRVRVLNRATGAAQEVMHVDNTAAGGGDGSAETPFNTLAAAQAAAGEQGIIYVHTGDGTDTGQDQGVTLDKTGQQLLGAGADFVYDTARFATANGASPTAVLIAPAAAAPVLSNVNADGDGVRVTANNVTVAGITVDGASRDGIVVEADGAAASAQNVVIADVTTQNNRTGIYIHGTNDGAVGALVQRSVATGNSQHGIAVYDDTDGGFTADLGGGFMGSKGLNVLAGNTLEDLAVDYDGATLSARNNWWGQASGPDTDDPSVGIAPQIYYGAPLNDGLVGHWTFDTEWTTNATAYDRSGNGNDGTLLGGLSLADSVNGVNRQALDFDYGHQTRHSDSSSLDIQTNSVTIVAWFNPDVDIVNSISPYPVLLIKRPYPVGGYAAHFLKANGTIVMQYCYPSNCSAVLSTSAFNQGQWYHYAGILDQNEIRVNINALQENQKPVAATIGSSAGTDLIIGSTFNSKLDDVRIYNRALSAPEIAELYRMDASSAVDTTGFLASAP